MLMERRERVEGEEGGWGRLKRWRCLGEEMIPVGGMDTKNVIIRRAVIVVGTKTDSNARALPKGAAPAPVRAGFPFDHLVLTIIRNPPPDPLVSVGTHAMESI